MYTFSRVSSPVSLVCNAMMLHLHQTRHRSSHDYMNIRLFHRLELIWLPLRCTPWLNYDWSIHHHRGVAHHCLLQLIPITRQVQYSFFSSNWDTLPKKTCFVERVSFSISKFYISTPLQCCNNVTVSTERISTLNRRREEFVYRQKRCVLPLWKDADRKRVCFLLKHVSIFVHDCTWASVFCIDMLLKKSLVSSTIWPILFCYVYEFLCSAGICGVVK